jgi:predicted RNA-binding Zn ribbon-like protein
MLCPGVCPVNSSLVVTVSDLRIEGGDVALDFVNTVGGMRDDPPDPEYEALHSYADLVQWCLRVGLLSPQQARELLREAQRHPRRAQRTFADALALRELLYEVFRPLAEGEAPPPPGALASLEEAERDALAGGRLKPDAAHVRWSWPGHAELGAPLWRVTHAAVELLAHGPLERLKVCANCRWLFLDQSRNRSRRWCSMADCGTAVKMERFVARRRVRRESAG